ncbi:unnamed protein product [Prunus armeniaca]|uniref:Uncharacterized protein n=1 Tax=Prunus armeniaca TaxID=36596 RepID=A0A6J5V298_PRUAR|nr:unnamed protein product [Prunus armeniaca]
MLNDRALPSQNSTYRTVGTEQSNEGLRTGGVESNLAQPPYCYGPKLNSPALLLLPSQDPTLGIFEPWRNLPTVGMPSSRLYRSCESRRSALLPNSSHDLVFLLLTAVSEPSSNFTPKLLSCRRPET